MLCRVDILRLLMCEYTLRKFSCSLLQCTYDYILFIECTYDYTITLYLRIAPMITLCLQNALMITLCYTERNIDHTLFTECTCDYTLFAELKPSVSEPAQAEPMLPKSPANRNGSSGRSSSCSSFTHHHRAGQELCYVCMQRSMRNIPVSFIEERKRKEMEQDSLLQQYQQMKDHEAMLIEKVRNSIRKAVAEKPPNSQYPR